MRFAFSLTTNSPRWTALHRCQVQLGEGMDKGIACVRRGATCRDVDTLATLPVPSRQQSQIAELRRVTQSAAGVLFFTSELLYYGVHVIDYRIHV